MEAFDKLKVLVAQAEEDVIKVDGGNKAAGTRLRKTMQEIKSAVQEVRVKVLEQRSPPA
ncbi:MAG: histone H1 [Planctomycetes bacterium]|nr:histone H1 [Planctomycetota bacterium]